MSETWPEIKKRKMRQRRSETFDWIQSVVMALLVCVLLFTFCVRIIRVQGTSMLNTLHDGDRLIVSNLLYTPEQGDIIVLRKQTFSDYPIVKRVIATEGQTVDIDFEQGIVKVDGTALVEDYVLEPINKRIDYTEPVVVPEGCVFVLGDNRNGSTDSRDDRIGCVDVRYIMGKAHFILLPGEDEDFKYGREWRRMAAWNEYV